MVFLNSAFFGDNNTRNNIVNMNGISSIKLDNGIYDNLYVTKDISNTIKLEWDYNTILYALFQNNLLAGNIGYSLNTITSIRIKMREKGDFNWVTIREIPISSVDDLKFIVTYPYCKGNTDYEFAMIPVLNGTYEGNLNIAECSSSFNGVYLIEPNAALHMFLNFEMQQQRNQTTSIIQTLGRKQPFYIANSQCNYDSGQISVTFIQMKDDCQLDVENGGAYRKYVDDVLVDRKPKILKFDDGRMWIVAITDNISQDSTGYNKMPIHSISWTEIADCNNAYDMYVNGFNDTYIEEEG